MTSHHHELVAKIQSTVAASPELQERLIAAQTLDRAAELLSHALGTPLSTADLQSLNDAAKEQLSDEQLEAVAAGGNGKIPGIMVSIFGIGAGCALVSAVTEIFDKKSGGCKGFFSDSH